MEEESKIKKYIKQLFDKFVVQGIWTILGAIALTIGTLIATKKLQFSILEYGLIVSFIFIIVIITSYIIYRRNNRRLPIFEQVDCDFHMLKEERIHKWLNVEDYIHIRRYTLKALRSNLTMYKDKFSWTGSDYTLSGGNAEYSVQLLTSHKNLFDQYAFIFARPLLKNQTIEVESTWYAKGPARPFFSTTIEEPTDLLIMSVTLYPDSKIKEVYCEVDSHKGANVPKIINKVRLDSLGEHKWTTKNPELLHHYEINWQ